MSINKVYLGDSVYVEEEPGRLKLTTNNGYPDDPRNVIYLGLTELSALEMYMEQLKKRRLM